MSCFSDNLKDRIISGESCTREEALHLVEEDLEEVCGAASYLRDFYAGRKIELCAIMNGKSGRCTEDCRFCSQSIFHKTHVEEYPLCDSADIQTDAVRNAHLGMSRFSVVTSGRRLSSDEFNVLREAFRQIKSRCDILLCVSCGFLSYEEFIELKKAGLTRYHNNLETSGRYFPQICTTHTYEDKLRSLREAKRAGLELCSGGIIGLGETWEDRVDMVLQCRDLKVDSIPVNVLNPISGTPLEGITCVDDDEICRTVAIFRFLMPDTSIRLAGGRGRMQDKGRRAFQAGANAAISGDMLTTSGVSVTEDIQIIRESGFYLDSLQAKGKNYYAE